MLNASDIVMVKRGQSFFGNYAAPRQPTSVDAFMAATAPTLADLYAAIRADHGISASEQSRIMAQLQAAVGMKPSSTPISSLMTQGLGGILGYLISKYFGMGVVSRAVSAFAGFGLGRAISRHMERAKDPYRGYSLYG